MTKELQGVTMTISLDHALRKRVDALSRGNRSFWVREAILQRVEREEKKAAKAAKKARAK